MFKTVLTAMFLTLIFSLQITGLPKLATGIAVNVIYIILYYSCGFRHVFMLAVLTPLLAFFTGHLPPPLILLAPFIAAGNIIMIYCYHTVKNKNIYIRVISPSLLKTFIIGVSGIVLAGKLGLDNIILTIIHVIVSIQFFTAVSGIILGEYIFKRIFPLLKRRLNINN